MVAPLTSSVAAPRFGELLRHHRAGLGLTQEELAERSGLSVRAIRNLELGRTERPQPQTVRLLASALELAHAEYDELRTVARRTPLPGERITPPGSGTTVDGNVRCELPLDQPALLGRDEVFVELYRSLTSAAAGPAVVTGAPGSGRTAVVVHVAHLVRDHFPDGQVYADLDRPDGDPTPPAAVLDRVLRSLDITVPPDSVEERAALLRSLLATRRVLVVLDNVSTAAQVRPLLAGVPGSAVLVSSRGHLPALTSRSVRLRPLAMPDAVGILAERAGHVRAVAEPLAATAIVAMCGYLPLAVHIAGMWLAARPERRLAELAMLLTGERRRLDRLAVGDLSMRASIAEYHRRLPAQDRHALERASKLDECTLADLDRDPVDAQDIAEELVSANLIVPTGAGRYRVDPLVRLYVADLSRTADSPPGNLRSLRTVATGRGFRS